MNYWWAHPLNCRAARGQSERRAPRLRPERQSEHRLDSAIDHSSEFYTPGALNQAVPAHRSVVCKTDSALRNICRLLSSRTRPRNFVKTAPNVIKLHEYIPWTHAHLFKYRAAQKKTRSLASAVELRGSRL